MRIGFMCCSCKTLFRVRDPEDGAHYVQLMIDREVSCPRCSGETCKLRFVVENVDMWDRDEEMTAEALWKYTMGLGRPEESNYTVQDMKELLEGATVEEAVLEKGSAYPLLRSLLLGCGLRVHLAAAGHGASVYKITKER